MHNSSYKRLAALLYLVFVEVPAFSVKEVIAAVYKVEELYEVFVYGGRPLVFTYFKINYLVRYEQVWSNLSG